MEETITQNENEKQNFGNFERKHKIPVPTQYRQAAKILKQIVEEGKSFKELVYNNKHIVCIKITQKISKITKFTLNPSF